MIALKEIKERLSREFDTFSVKDGVVTVRREFFYTFGKTADDKVAEVLAAFPDVTIVDKGEVWRPFRGGSDTAHSSHWYVKFTLPD